MVKQSKVMKHDKGLPVDSDAVQLVETQAVQVTGNAVSVEVYQADASVSMSSSLSRQW